jgi:phosphoheptose isomerase
MNLVNANLYAKKSGLKVVTLTGCKKSNKFNNLKNDLNIWINSEKYNLIEIIHHAILLNLIDSIMEDKNF